MGWRDRMSFVGDVARELVAADYEPQCISVQRAPRLMQQGAMASRMRDAQRVVMGSAINEYAYDKNMVEAAHRYIRGQMDHQETLKVAKREMEAKRRAAKADLMGAGMVSIEMVGLADVNYMGGGFGGVGGVGGGGFGDNGMGSSGTGGGLFGV